MFVGKLYESRPSYRFLGILVCIQLAISAGSWAYSQANLSREEQLEPNTDFKAGSEQKAVVLKVTLQ